MSDNARQQEKSPPTSKPTTKSIVFTIKYKVAAADVNIERVLDAMSEEGSAEIVDVDVTADEEGAT